MEIDPALISVILGIISVFTLVSRVKWLIRIGKFVLMLTLIYSVIFIPQVKDFFVAIFDAIKHAISTVFGLAL